MSTPIGKGARFRVMAGDYRGREGTIICTILGSADVWILNLGEGTAIDFTQADADGPAFQRLADAPVKPDPLFAEIESTIRRLNILPDEGAENALDMVASIADLDATGADDSALRNALLECAAFCFAGLRDLDRGAR